MSVSPVTQQPVKTQPPGYVETAVKWLANKISKLVCSLFEWLGWQRIDPQISPKDDHRFERSLLKKLERQSIAPSMVLRQFKRYLPEDKQLEVFETLGRGGTLGTAERLWHWLRTDDEASCRYRELGEVLGKEDPYRLAPALQEALRETIRTS